MSPLPNVPDFLLCTCCLLYKSRFINGSIRLLGNEACHITFENIVTESIYGTLTRPDGSPAVGVCIWLYDDADHEIFAGKSDDAGQYRMPSLKDGLYTLKMRAYSGVCNIEGEVRVARGFNHRIDVRLEECMEC